MNIDKDIEKLRNLKTIQVRGEFNSGEFFNVGLPQDDLDAIENVILELERYKRIANMNLKDSEEFEKNMCEHRCPLKTGYEEELETWKKIAEKLAIGCKQLFKECPIYCEEVCEERKANKKTCVECLIDHARKEVEKDV